MTSDGRYTRKAVRRFTIPGGRTNRMMSFHIKTVPLWGIGFFKATARAVKSETYTRRNVLKVEKVNKRPFS